jgi:hypothetical protein
VLLRSRAPRRQAVREQPRARRHQEAAARGRSGRWWRSAAAAGEGQGQQPVRRFNADERVDVQELGGVAELDGDQGLGDGVPLLVIVAPELGAVGVVRALPQVRRGHGLLPPGRRPEAHRDRQAIVKFVLSQGMITTHCAFVNEQLR